MIAGWPHGDPRDLARAIVADPRYTGATAPNAAPPGLLERILRALADRAGALLRGISHVLGAQHPLGIAIGVGALVLALAALAYLALRLIRARPVRRFVRRAAGVPLDEPPDSRAWFERARAAAGAERWREAASALFVSALRALDERGRLAYDPARTAGEACRAIRDPAFDVLAREGSIALFDGRGATAERFARMRAAYLQYFGPVV